MPFYSNVLSVEGKLEVARKSIQTTGGKTDYVKVYFTITLKFRFPDSFIKL